MCLAGYLQTGPKTRRMTRGTWRATPCGQGVSRKCSRFLRAEQIAAGVWRVLRNGVHHDVSSAVRGQQVSSYAPLGIGKQSWCPVGGRAQGTADDALERQPVDTLVTVPPPGGSTSQASVR